MVDRQEYFTCPGVFLSVALQFLPRRPICLTFVTLCP